MCQMCLIFLLSVRRNVERESRRGKRTVQVTQRPNVTVPNDRKLPGRVFPLKIVMASGLPGLGVRYAQLRTRHYSRYLTKWRSSAVFFAYQQCSATCDDGTQTREVICMTFIRGQYRVGLDMQCPARDKPSTNTTCNLGKCLPQWYTSDWSEVCSINPVFLIFSVKVNPFYLNT